MRVIGIIGEYNPFHFGHAHHFAATREALGTASPIVCVLSGNFVQRGDAALYSKFARAEAAVRCGADLVFELPLPWSLSSAEGFARGAVGLLGALGVVTDLSFGSECGAVRPLDTLAVALLDPAMDKKIQAELLSGISYAAARQNVLSRELGQTAELLKEPNNILAVEYLKAIHDQRLNLSPWTTPRVGAAHDAPHSRGKIRSATELRALQASGKPIWDLVPEEAAQVFRREAESGRGPVTIRELETAILSRLRMLSETAFNRIPGAGEGLGNRLCRAAWEEPTLDGILSAAKTKRYALSRLRRMVFCAALGVQIGMDAGIPPYARLLAATERGRELLRDIARNGAVPVLTKPASVRDMDAEARRLFELECAADDLYVLGYAAREERRGGSDWRTSPILVPTPAAAHSLPRSKGLRRKDGQE